MTNTAPLGLHVQAGRPLSPWLVLGPFYEDVSNRVHSASLFESTDATRGADVADECVQSLRPLLTAPCQEGQVVCFRGQSAAWRLDRRPDPYRTWGQYYKPHHLVTAIMSTKVIADTPAAIEWRCRARIAERVLVAVNGTIVADDIARPRGRDGESAEFRFGATLDAGENVVSVALVRIGRMARVGISLEADTPVCTSVPLPESVTAETRQRIEEQVASLRLPRDLYYPCDDIAITVGESTPEDTTARMTLSRSGAVLRDIPIAESGHVSICPAADLADGRYNLECIWHDADGSPLTSVIYPMLKTTPIPPTKGYDALSDRQQALLQHFAATVPEGKRADVGIWREVARYALGRYKDIDPQTIRETYAFITSPVTGSDFPMQGLLRLVAWEHRERRLSAELNALMDDAILRYKYWADEPGPSKYFGSENHRLMYHAAEWLAGLLFPTQEFPNSRQRGLFHVAKGRMYLMEWMRQRGRHGFDEWHSNAYFGADIPPLLNVYDFCLPDDVKMKQLAGFALDYLFFILAADTFQGRLGTSHGRTYGRLLKYPPMEANSPVTWLLYGTGALTALASSNASVSLATSTYGVPRILYDIANDREAVIESKQRQGLRSEHPQHAEFCVYRTPDYMISGLQDYAKGEYQHAVHAAQVTMGNGVCIYWSSPYTSDEGGGQRPDYWSGSNTLPRVIQYRNVMSLTFHLDEYAWMSHCFYEQDRFDQVRLEGNWAFGRVSDGYVGIYSENGMDASPQSAYARREIQCQAPRNTWLVECGRRQDWGDFDAFVAALREARIGRNGDALCYESPSVGRFVTGWECTPTINSQPIPLRGYPLVQSPWANSAFGSGSITIQHDGDSRELWFSL